MHKMVIIGCNSFTGAYVVDELLATGQYYVIGVDREEKTDAFLPYVSRKLSKFQFFKADINKNMEELKMFLMSEQPDYVMNLAALSEVAPSWDNPAQWMRTNVVSLTELVDFLRQLPSLKKFTQVSTPEVYGSVTGRIDETAPLYPSTPYAVSKAGFDFLLNAFFKNYNFPVVYMRASNVYGAGQQLFKIVPRTIIYLRLGKTLQLHGGGTAVRSFIHVRDVARAYIDGVLKGKAGEVYHVSPDDSIRIRDLVKQICEMVGKDFDSATEEVEARMGHDDVYMLDSSKAREEFGWRPTVSLQTGLGETIEWINKNWEEIKEQSLEYVHVA